tara:strand:+ start:560 stop:811 length:252 start_codon:yes stop_codon:yes gene_type:complete
MSTFHADEHYIWEPDPLVLEDINGDEIFSEISCGIATGVGGRFNIKRKEWLVNIGLRLTKKKVQNDYNILDNYYWNLKLIRKI